MKPIYTAYAKSIDGITFYFVKSYLTLPEHKNVPPIPRTYGMHTNFEQACRIAAVNDKEIQQQLINEMEKSSASSKVLPLYPAVAEIYSLKRHTAFSPILRLIGLG
ncbi:MAG TPA: hypothetical protein VMY77_12765 [Chitinophagaceae bacterium]|nr:hypothetical protein [Chitinophagaceae bacterium]